MLEAQRLSIHLASSMSLYDRPDFLASLEGQTERSYQVTQVDLGTNKGSGSTFEILRPDVVHLRTFRNIGVARGQNQAIALALSRWSRADLPHRYVVIARPEIAFDSRACEEICRAMDADPTLMIAGPKILWAEASAVSQTEGDWVELSCSNRLYAVGLGLTRARSLVFLGDGKEDDGSFDSGEGVFLLSDACVIIRASALEKLALYEGVWFDPQLPMFYAMLDLCWRAAWCGWRARIIPEVKVWFAPKEGGTPGRRRWREGYVPASMRSRVDDIGLRIAQLPWVAGAYIRYRFSRLFSGTFWRLRTSPDPGAIESLPDKKFDRGMERKALFAERRRWFMR